MTEEQKKETEAKPVRPTIVSEDKEIAFRPKNFEELWGFAKIIAETEFVPTSDKGKPGQVLAKIQYGHEVGLPPMQSLRFIVLINGIPSIYGDGYWMLIKHHPLCEWTDEATPEEALAKGYGQCTIMRHGDPKPTTRTFSIEEAKKADLWGDKKDNWRKYPGRMLMWRARHLCGSAAIPEASGGLMPSELAYDYETTATEVKEEPLKIPQAITETPPPQPETESSGESQVEDAGQPVGGDKKDVNDGQKTTEQKKLTPAEIKADILDWLENRATREEIISNKNYLTMRMTKASGLSQQDQLEIVKAWNLKRKEVPVSKKAEDL